MTNEHRRETRPMPDGHNKQVRTVQRDKAVSLLAIGTPVKEICSQLKTTKKTIYKWLKEPGFKQKIEEERELINIASTSILGSVLEEASIKMCEAIRADDMDMVKFLLKESGALRTTGSRHGMEQKTAGAGDAIQIVINVDGNGLDQSSVVDAEIVE